MAFSGRVIEGETFRREVFKGETFARISHCTFENCWFHDCIFDNCIISRSSITGSKFNFGCTWKQLRILGVCHFDGNNVEIKDFRVGGRGYVAIIGKNGFHIGCQFNGWEDLSIDLRKVIKMDGKNAVYWWKKFKPQFEEIGRKRGWIT